MTVYFIGGPTVNNWFDATDSVTNVKLVDKIIAEPAADPSIITADADDGDPGTDPTNPLVAGYFDAPTRDRPLDLVTTDPFEVDYDGDGSADYTFGGAPRTLGIGVYSGDPDLSDPSYDFRTNPAYVTTAPQEFGNYKAALAGTVWEGNDESDIMTVELNGQYDTSIGGIVSSLFFVREGYDGSGPEYYSYQLLTDDGTGNLVPSVDISNNPVGPVRVRAELTGQYSASNWGYHYHDFPDFGGGAVEFDAIRFVGLDNPDSTVGDGSDLLFEGLILEQTQEAPPSGGPGDGSASTRGYWRQVHHFDDWPAPYTPETPFSDTFGLNAAATDALRFDDNLLGALDAKGGQLNQLGAQGTAALLNSASADAVFAYSNDNGVTASDELIIGAGEAGTSVGQVLPILNAIDDIVVDGILSPGEIIDAVGTVFNSGSYAGYNATSVALALDAMNNMPEISFA